MKILKLSILLTNLFFSINLIAKEGFFEKNYFSEINPKWIQQTVMVYSESFHAPMGTAFLYTVDEKSAYFVSAKHVLTHCLVETKCSLRWGTAWHKKYLTKEEGNPDFDFTSVLNFKIEKIGVFKGKEKESFFASDLAIAIVDIKNLPQHFVSLGNEELEKSFKSLI